mmetsp:Transcript_31712/g.43275  ORF Transcript_31712/g.43275 Transcript_31712/m.43275 type:complete len:259 (+) Transcript_31712:37-813(+)|eukprot:CAMPEP_0170073088 /NCGR_PEP_ID=MMETSP0019_2-20121128/10565_1 /TAXON_ID=98059 /ORGANISM="Dinobryon sp., Strain UTEXLB2267" /LENGTH=258 /DNA_ID=CAMNT_0010282387 /DNA_START=25 /DNA_END=801 /DNA_ORIENTATION=+
MFRESDEKPPKLHPSYRMRPVPTLQMIAQEGKFEDQRVLSTRSKLDDEIPAVPASSDVFYDPTHPDADWAGLVSRNHVTQKKHCHDHRSQQVGIKMEEGGIVSKEQNSGFSRKSGNLEQATIQNNGSIVIAGINSDESRWKTSYNSFEHQESTSKDQLILMKRVGTRRPLQDPAQTKSIRCSDTVGMIDNNSYNTIKATTSSSSLRGKSFISNIGAQIAHKVPDMQTAIGPTATPVDPRSMHSANYNPYPGFTGKKLY